MTMGKAHVLRLDPANNLQKPNALSHTGPIRENHPNIRAVMSGSCCGTLYAYDILDKEDWGGEGEGYVTYVKLTGQNPDNVLDMPRSEPLKPTPRLTLSTSDETPILWIDC